MNRRQLGLNALSAALQVVITGVVYIVLYRFLLDQLGDVSFGVWALVLALSSVSNVANLGLASACVPFVARSLAEDDEPGAADIVSTAAVSVGSFLILALSIGYPIVRAILPLLANEPSAVGQAVQILPFALVSLWCASLSSVFLSSLEGCQRMDLRSYLLMGVVLVYLAAALILVPRLGLMGVAYAHLAHTVSLLVASWLALKTRLPSLQAIPLSWSRNAFRKIYRYGGAMQIISVAQVLSEPVAKSLVSYFGGLGLLSLYEFASRMAIQLRTVIATAHRAVVPAIAELRASGEEAVINVFKRSHVLLQYLVALSLPLLLAILPLVSIVWIGRYEPFFVYSGGILLGAWFLNLLANPAYYGFLGEGLARWPTIAHLIIGIGNVILGGILGFVLGAHGVIVGYAAALLVASAAVSWAYRKKHRVPLADLLSAASLQFAIATVLAGAMAFGSSRVTFVAERPVAALLLAALVYTAIMAVPVAKNPVLRDVIRWARRQDPSND